MKSSERNSTWVERLYGDRLPTPEQVDDIRHRAYDLAVEMDRLDGLGLAIYHKASHDLIETLDLCELDRQIEPSS